MDNYYLIYVGDNKKRTRKNLSGTLFTIGRRKIRDIVISGGYAYISRDHVELTLKCGKWFVRDTSKHGTWLNNKRLIKMKEQQLEHEDKIILIDPESIHPQSPNDDLADLTIEFFDEDKEATTETIAGDEKVMGSPGPNYISRIDSEYYYGEENIGFTGMQITVFDELYKEKRVNQQTIEKVFTDAATCIYNISNKLQKFTDYEYIENKKGVGWLFKNDWLDD